MFQVKNKETGQEYTVYAVGDEYLTKFLICSSDCRLRKREIHMKITRTIKFKEYILGYLEKLEVHEVRRIEKAGRLSRDIIKEESEKCGHKLMILDTIEKERRYECSLEDFLSVAREIPLKDQETVNTEEKNVQEDNSEDSKSKLGDSDCAPWIED